MFVGRSMVLLLCLATLALAQLAEAQPPVPPAIAPAQAAGLDAELTASSHGAGPAPLLDFMELGIRTKVRRLRIAGWTLVGAGVLMIPAYFIDASQRDPVWASDEETGAFMRRAVLLYGFGTAAILAAGGAMLLRARLVLRRFRRLREAAGVALDAPSRLDVGLSLGGARMTLRF